MAALFDITQDTLGPGLGPGHARIDGVPGELVTITIQDQTVQEVQVTLEWTPPDDEVAFFNLAVTPDIKEWTFTPDANAINASGSYLIHVVTDASSPARRDEAILVFGIVTPNSGLVIPALNEPGNPLASLTQPDAPGAANNVPFLGPGRNVAGSPIADIDFAAWWKALADLILVVDGFSGGAGEVNTGVDVGTGVPMVDGPNVGVQIPFRSLDGINDVGVALNGQTVEVDGILLLDLTAVRHIVGPDFLTLQYASNPTIQLHNDTSGSEINKRWSIQGQVPDGPPRLIIGAAAADGSELGEDNAGLIIAREAGTANIEFATLVGDTVRLQSGQVTGTGTVLIRPDGVVSDDYPLLTMQSNGTFNASVEWHVGGRSPVGNVPGSPGDFYVRADDGVDSTFYQHNGAVADNTSWVEFGAGSVGLQSAYGSVNTIAATAALPIAFSNAVDATDLLTITRTFAGSGRGIALSMPAGGGGAAGVGDGIFIDWDVTDGSGSAAMRIAMDAAAEGEGLVIAHAANTGGGDLLSVENSAGIIVQIAASGAATIAANSDQGAALTAAGTGDVTVAQAGTGNVDILTVDGFITLTSAAAGIALDASEDLDLFSGGVGFELNLNQNAGDQALLVGSFRSFPSPGVNDVTKWAIGSSESRQLPPFIQMNTRNPESPGNPSTFGIAGEYESEASPFDNITGGTFTPGVDATSNPTVATDSASGFSAGEIVRIVGDTTSTLGLNDGYYEVVSHAANLLTVRGVGTADTVERWTSRQFVTETGVNYTVRQVMFSVLQANGVDGIWESAQGDTTPLVFTRVGSGVTISPAALPAGPTENYQPVDAASWDGCTFVRATSSANAVVGGLITTTSGQDRVRYFLNANGGGGFTITLTNQGGGGAASSDIIIAGGDLVLQPGESALIWEDQTTGNWRVL